MSVPKKHQHISKYAMIIDTTIAIIFFCLGLYHFTQPDQAWRSGIAEVTSAALLLIAAYLVSRHTAMIINIIVAVIACSLGVRHLIHGGGWKSGISELLVIAVLISVAYTIYKHRNTKAI